MRRPRKMGSHRPMTIWQHISGNQNSSETTTNSVESTTLNLNMSAKELRAKLAAREKYDPKKDSLDIKKKHEIIQKL
ncbi:unnamed protein product [Bemisia tabaci]|uniref:Uncharacterized protein n=1 Tax=Bemisia tabaci TaxID=7038 RepID=A0A9P0EZX4_BEMTA|nr:unnamed protein product [Bemisia tabaci]